MCSSVQSVQRAQRGRSGRRLLRAARAGTRWAAGTRISRGGRPRGAPSRARGPAAEPARVCFPVPLAAAPDGAKEARPLQTCRSKAPSVRLPDLHSIFQ